MEEILHLLIGSFSHYLEGFIHPRQDFFHQQYFETSQGDDNHPESHMTKVPSLSWPNLLEKRRQICWTCPSPVKANWWNRWGIGFWHVRFGTQFWTKHRADSWPVMQAKIILIMGSLADCDVQFADLCAQVVCFNTCRDCRWICSYVEAGVKTSPPKRGPFSQCAA